MNCALLFCTIVHSKANGSRLWISHSFLYTTIRPKTRSWKLLWESRAWAREYNDNAELGRAIAIEVNFIFTVNRTWVALCRIGVARSLACRREKTIYMRNSENTVCWMSKSILKLPTRTTKHNTLGQLENLANWLCSECRKASAFFEKNQVKDFSILWLYIFVIFCDSISNTCRWWFVIFWKTSVRVDNER